MSSTPENRTKDAPNQPKAQESEWYNKHYQTSGTAPSAEPLAEPELSKHLGPWYGYALPHLRTVLTKESRLLELGCGTGRLPTQLFREGVIPAENLFGLDQSEVALEQARRAVPGAHFTVGDIYDLKFPREHFNCVMLMEVIEHLESPDVALKQIAAVIAPGGYLYISFPNFVHLPWLAVRILSEKLNRPNWIVLQPIDKIYTVWAVRKLAEAAGFTLETAIGSNYGPPVLYPLERPWMTRGLNRLGLWWTSFHPIMVFRKRA
jgi:2-polyprenyl-3-methyl-5-hydroxy-6-metoxy-1,4-benzoquinol methylase